MTTNFDEQAVEPETERWLRQALENERERTRELEALLEKLRTSESFRMGQAISLAARYRLGRSLRFLIPRRYRLRLLASAQPLPTLLSGDATKHMGPSGTPETVVFVCIEGDSGRARQALDQVERLATMLVALRPVVISDVPDPERWAEAQLVIEHVIGYDDWTRFRPAAEWGEYVAERISSVLEEYASQKVISLSAFGPSPAASAAAMAPVVLPMMGRSQTNLV
jgi:hypothetical protein